MCLQGCKTAALEVPRRDGKESNLKLRGWAGCKVSKCELIKTDQISMSILKSKQILEGVQDVCVRMKLENIEKIG